MGLTVAQKIMRPFLNWAVETLFPNGAFYGGQYLRNFDHDAVLQDKWGTVEMACAMLIVSRVRNMNAEKASFEATDITDSGVMVGSWRLTVEKIEEPTQ